MDSLSFRIPEQHTPTKDSFDIRPQAVQRWAEELPMGDTGEAARRLFAMLQETNRLKFAPALRAEVLGMVAPALDSVLSTLLHHYTGLSFPLPQKSVRIAQFANRLLAEAVIAYQAVLNARQDASWLFRMTHHHLWVRSIHHMLVYLERIIANYRFIHRPYPTGVWLALHQLYLQAQSHGRTAEKVALPGKERQRSTIEQEYKRALLLSLLEPQLFRRSQLGEVQATMAYWLEQVQLTPAKKHCKEVAAYCIRADQDAPYTVQTEQCCQECEKVEYAIMLEMEQLAGSIDKALARMGDEHTTMLRGCKAPVSHATLEILQQCWRSPQSKRQERLKSHRMIQAAIGMSAIHALRRHDAAVEGEHGVGDHEMSETLHPLFEEPKQAPKPGGDEVWDAIFFGTEIGYNAWALDAEEKNYQFLEAREVNYTETGRCLVFNSSDVESLQVGELVGVRDAEGETLQLSMVRWLLDNDSSLSVGLMRLASEVESVLVLQHKGEGDAERKTAFGCLLGIGEDKRPQLFLPYLPGSSERSFYIAVDDKELPVTLHEKVAASPLFEAYHFGAAESLHEPSTAERMPLGEVNRRLHHIAHSDEAAGVHSKDDFSDVWDAL